MRTFAVKQVPKYIKGDPNEKLPRLMELADTFSPEGWYGSRRSALCTVITRKNGWFCGCMSRSPDIRKGFLASEAAKRQAEGMEINEPDAWLQRAGCMYAIGLPWMCLTI